MGSISLFYFIFTLFLPSVSLSIGVGGIPLRYFSIPFVLFAGTTPKVALYFLAMIPAHLLFLLISYFLSRDPHLVDVSYLMTYIYVFFGLCIVHNHQRSFHKFIVIFFLMNSLYFVFQNISLNLGVFTEYLMLHQNTHAEGYSIPNSYLPYLWRATGLFNESIPFVIYMMITFYYFYKVARNKLLSFLSFVLILASGAKLSIVFFLFFLLVMIVRNKLRLSLVFFVSSVGGLFFVLAFEEKLKNFLLLSNDLFSVYLRIEGLLASIKNFLTDPELIFFGSGFVSSYDLLHSSSNSIQRGTDFFSLYVYSNGLVGLFLINIPLLFFFRFLKRSLPVFDINYISLVFILSLMTMGAFTAYNYSYLVFVLYLSVIRHKSATNNDRILATSAVSLP